MAKRTQEATLGRIWEEITDLRKRLRLVERQATQWQAEWALMPEEEFRNEFANEKVDRQLFALVGIDPPLSLEEEKEELADAIADAYRAKGQGAR